MRYGTQTLRAIDERYRRARTLAKAKVEKLNALLNDDENYVKAYNAVNSAKFEIAKAKFNGDETSLLKANEALEKGNEQLDAVIKSHGISPKDLIPDYTCKICEDTGFNGDKRCKCFNKIASEVVTEELGISKKSLPDFEHADYINTPDEKVYLKMRQFADKAGEVNKFVTLLGKVGSGKTYLAGCIANQFEKMGKIVVFISSYELQSVFARTSSLYDLEREGYLSALTECDLLVIDDLGSEMTFKNVSFTCLYTILSARSDKNLPLIVTTNLSVDEIYDFYGERISSRLFTKGKSLAIEINGRDFRRKR